MIASVPNEGEQQALLNRRLSGAGASVSRDASNKCSLGVLLKVIRRSPFVHSPSLWPEMPVSIDEYQLGWPGLPKPLLTR